MPPAQAQQAVRPITISSAHTLDGVAMMQTSRHHAGILKTLAIEVLVCPASSVAPGFGLAMPIMSSDTNIQGLGRGVRSIKAIVGCCMELDEADLWEERDNVNHTGTWCRVWHATAVCCGFGDS